MPQQGLRSYFSRRMLLIAALGFYSGLPLALSASTLSAWLADRHIDRATIGLFAAVATPYAIKFLWAPLMDGVRLPLLGGMGRRRSWLFFIQSLLVLAIVWMSRCDPAGGVSVTAFAALIVATLSATQDIVIDAYRVERLTKAEQGEGAAMSTFGYRIGMLTSGAGALALADRFGWSLTYIAMAALLATSLVVTLLAKEPDVVKIVAHNFREFIAGSVIAPLKDFMTRRQWATVLAFVVLYKLGDAVIGTLFNPWLLSIGFSKTQIAEIVKLYGLIATLLGSFAGGWCVMRFGTFRTLLIGGIVHTATNLLLVAQTLRGPDVPFLGVTIAVVNFTGGLSLAAFVAYLSALCADRYTATQYALLSALAALGRTLLSTPAGWLAQRFGWNGFFWIATALAVPGLVLLLVLRRHEHLTKSTNS